jgi:hypothetical protein
MHGFGGDPRIEDPGFGKIIIPDPVLILVSTVLIIKKN